MYHQHVSGSNQRGLIGEAKQMKGLLAYNSSLGQIVYVSAIVPTEKVSYLRIAASAVVLLKAAPSFAPDTGTHPKALRSLPSPQWPVLSLTGTEPLLAIPCC